METKEVQRIANDLNKASALSSSSTSYFNKTLEELETKVVATEELLRATRIGVAVNKLKQFKDPAIAKRATDLVNKWRKDVKAVQSSKEKVNGGSSTPTSKSRGDTPAAASNEAAANGKFKSSVPAEKRTSQTDNVDTKVTDSAMRDNCVKLMYDGLAFMSEEPPTKILPVAKAIEAAAFALHHPNPASEPSTEYKTKMRSLFQNFKQKSNTHLRSSMLSGNLQPERLVRMTSDELKSDKRKEEDEKMQKENMDKAMVAQEEKSISSSLQCSKCKQRKVSYSQAQTRSADEPMTTFCECTVCGHRWKFS